MKRYHDLEWGRPSYDDSHLFEMLVLESAQAGLSWATILNKREGYRSAFGGFDPARAARFGAPEVEALVSDARIVRNRQKILSAIGNANSFVKVAAEQGSFASYLWSWVGHEPVQNNPPTPAAVPTRSPLSDALSKDLKRRDFSFVGTTIVYSYLQAVGVVNDHLASCPARAPL